MNEMADIETIDKTWMIATGAPEGPFAILDSIGITSAFNIVVAEANTTGNPEFAKLANLLKTEYPDKGNLGSATGRDFCTYPNPSFASPNFLRNSMDMQSTATQMRPATVVERALLRFSH